jgi:hypothetical protein
MRWFSFTSCISIFFRGEMHGWYEVAKGMVLLITTNYQRFKGPDTAIVNTDMSE